MTKYFCDKCGQESKEQTNVTIYKPHICDHTDGHRFTTENSYSLCDDCLLKVVKWIDGKGQLDT